MADKDVDVEEFEDKPNRSLLDMIGLGKKKNTDEVTITVRPQGDMDLSGSAKPAEEITSSVQPLPPPKKVQVAGINPDGSIDPTAINYDQLDKDLGEEALRQLGVSSQVVPTTPDVAQDANVRPDVDSAIEGVPTEVSEKVGSTSTTSVTPTAGFNQAMGDMKSATAANDKALQDQSKAIEGMVEVEATRNQIIADRLSATASEQQVNDQVFESEMADSRKRIQDAQAAYTGFKFKDFWDSDHANKLSSAISIGLGSIGASLTGQQNIGQVLLQRKMEDFADQQRMELAKLAKGVDFAATARTNTIQDYKLAQEIATARSAAAVDQINKRYDGLAARAKLPETQAKIEQQRAQFNEQAAKEQANLQDKLKTTTIIQQDQLRKKKVLTDPSLYITADGKPMNNKQSDVFSAATRGAVNAMTLSKYEKEGITTTAGYDTIRKLLMTEAQRNSNSIAQFSNGQLAMLQGDEFQASVASNPRLADYVRTLQDQIAVELKASSGATVTDAERMDKFRRAMPISLYNLNPEQQQQTVRNDATRRTQEIDSLFKQSGSNTRISKHAKQEMGLDK